LKRSNLNVQEDGIIQWRASVWGVGVEPCICYRCAKNFKCTFFCASVRQKMRSHIWPSQITNHKICVCDSQTQMRYGNAPWECSNE
jgi:hypothetical protein